MKIVLNKIEYEFPDGATIERVVGTRLITSVSHIWVNDKPVKKSECGKYVLKDGDILRVKRIMTGG